MPGYSVLTSNNISNVGGMFVVLAPFEERVEHGLLAPTVLASLRTSFRQIQEAQVVAFGAPPVEGLGSTGGFKLQLQDRGDLGPEALQAAAENILEKGAAQPGLVGLFSSFRANQPQLYLDVNRTQAKTLGVSLDDVFNTLQVYLGSSYANDFTRFGRNWQVNVQADAAFRISPEDIGRLKVRNAAGDMVPLAALVSVRDIDRSGDRESLQHVPLGRSERQHRARLQFRPGDCVNGTDRQAGIARGHELRVDGTHVTPDPGGEYGGLRLCAGDRVRLPRARCPVRKLVLAVRHHFDRAHVFAGGYWRCVVRKGWRIISSRKSACWC